MKKYTTFGVIILLLSILSGCVETEEVELEEPTGPPAFEAINFTPDTATKIEIFALDFEKDGINEQAIYYKNQEEISEAEFIMHEYVEVYKLDNNEWKLINKQIFANESYIDKIENASEEEDSGIHMEAKQVSSVNVIDVADDNKEELIIYYNDANENIGYVVIGLIDGRINELDTPRGLDAMGDAAINFYGGITGVNFQDGVIKEHWGGLCEGGTNPCYRFEFHVNYDAKTGVWEISKAQNIEKIDEEWDKYVETYPDALPWTGELAF